jgi:Ni/Fe-hydrogenase 1 B-type cytochrome subunit
MNVRIVHYCVMFLFILFIFIHVYLSLFEGSGLVANMFLRKEHPGYVCDPKTGEIIGFDDLSDTPEYKAKLAKKQKQAAKRAAKEMES